MKSIFISLVILASFVGARLGPPLARYSFNVDEEFDIISSDVELKKDAVNQALKLGEIAANEKYFRQRLGYSSNKIEGNPLSAREVSALLETGFPIKVRKVTDYLEIVCHNRALEVVQRFAKEGEDFCFADESFVRALHGMCLPPALCDADALPGKFKKRENYVLIHNPAKPESVEELSFCPPNDVPGELFTLLSWCDANIGKCNHVEFLTILHYNFLRVHPFEDGNGRMSRLLMAYFCIRNGYPPVIIEPADRAEYFQTLSAAHLSGDLLPLAKFLGRAMIKCYDKVVKDLSSGKM